MFSEIIRTAHRPLDAQDVAQSIDGKTLIDALVRRHTVDPQGRAYLVKKNDRYQAIHWGSFYRQIRGVVGGLQSLGISRGDRVAILSDCRPEWTAADLGIMSCGAITIPIYQSGTADDVAYILNNSDSKLVFAEDSKQVAKLEAAFRKLNKRLPIVVFEREEGATALAYETFVVQPVSEEEMHNLASRLRPQDTASIVYTSGTTGQPKGVLIAHSCFAAELRSICREFELTKEDTTLTFLPFAHVLGRVESFLPLYAGITLGFAENISSISQNLVELKPTLMMSVPRIFEKLQAKIYSEIKNAPVWEQKVFAWAEKTGREAARRRAENQSIPLALAAKLRVADRLVFKPIRERLGGKLRLAVSGGAPIASELCEFFFACGIPVVEGYGLSETTGAIAVNRPDDFRFGTVGRPLAETEFRIAQDGEILVRGPALFKGYLNDPAATAEALSKEGWFATGDIGEIDDLGFIRITDRKKELIVTAGGKNVAPAKLENLLKAIPHVSNALVFGDKKKYLVALLTLDPQTVPPTAERQTEIEKEIKRINSTLASYESIKRFEILPRDFSIEEGELTPSLKVKRKVCIEHFRETIDSMYGA